MAHISRVAVISHDTEIVGALARNPALKCFTTFGAARAFLLGAEGAEAIVVPLDALHDVPADESATILGNNGKTKSVLAISSLHASDCRHLIALAGAGLFFEVLLTPFDQVAVGTQAWLRRIAPEPSPLSKIIASFGSSADLNTSAVVVAGAAIGGRRVEVQVYASAAGLPQRTLRERLSIGGLPSPHRFLGWMLALHTAWRLEHHRVNYRGAAETAGIDTVEALSAFLRSHVGLPIRKLEELGFDRLLLWCLDQRSRRVPS